MALSDKKKAACTAALQSKGHSAARSAKACALSNNDPVAAHEEALKEEQRFHLSGKGGLCKDEGLSYFIDPGSCRVAYDDEDGSTVRTYDTAEFPRGCFLNEDGELSFNKFAEPSAEDKRHERCRQVCEPAAFVLTSFAELCEDIGLNAILQKTYCLASQGVAQFAEEHTSAVYES